MLQFWYYKNTGMSHLLAFSAKSCASVLFEILTWVTYISIFAEVLT